MIDILQRHLSHPHLGLVIGKALDLIGSSEIDQDDGPTGAGQLSKNIADLYAYRKRSGYYNPASVVGLDETINVMGSIDTTVHLRVVETSRGYIAVWLNDQNEPLGVMILMASLKEK